jgi:phage-related protein
MAGKNYLLRNINNKNECLLWLLSEKKLSNYNEVFSEWEYIGKALSYKATGCFEKDMKDICGNFEEKDYMEIMWHLSDLEKVILTRTVTRFSHPLIPEDKVYEYRLNLSNGNQLRMTYKNISPIWFLTAFIKKSERTPRHERDRARKQLSECQ